MLPCAQIVMQTCAEHNVRYVVPDSPFQIWKEMVHSFATPQSLAKEILIYDGNM